MPRKYIKPRIICDLRCNFFLYHFSLLLPVDNYTAR